MRGFLFGVCATAVLVAIAGCTDRTPPSDVASLSATVTSSGMFTSRADLGWGPATDNRAVAGYKVYRDGIYVATVHATSYSDPGLEAGRPYAYIVNAFDAAGNESARPALAPVRAAECNLSGPWKIITDASMDSRTEPSVVCDLSIPATGCKVIANYIGSCGSSIFEISIDISGEGSQRGIRLIQYRQFPSVIYARYEGRLTGEATFEGSWHDDLGRSGDFRLQSEEHSAKSN